MGKLVEFSCPDCGFRIVGKYGIGKTDLALGTQNFASEEEREVGVDFQQYIVDNPHEVDFIRALIRKHRPVILQSWEHQPYHCPHCARLYNRFTYHFLFKNDDYVPHFTCLDCGRVLEKLDMKHTALCPECKKGRLRVDNVTDWK